MNNTTSTSINIDNQKTELIKEQAQAGDTKFSPSATLNQKNEQILTMQQEIFNLKSENEKLKNSNDLSIKSKELYESKLKSLTKSITDKYGVNDFDLVSNMSNLNFESLEKYEKSIINVFETTKTKYTKPEVVVNQRKPYRIYI